MPITVQIKHLLNGYIIGNYYCGNSLILHDCVQNVLCIIHNFANIQLYRVHSFKEENYNLFIN